MALLPPEVTSDELVKEVTMVLVPEELVKKMAMVLVPEELVKKVAMVLVPEELVKEVAMVLVMKDLTIERVFVVERRVPMEAVLTMRGARKNCRYPVWKLVVDDVWEVERLNKNVLVMLCTMT